MHCLVQIVHLCAPVFRARDQFKLEKARSHARSRNTKSSKYISCRRRERGGGLSRRHLSTSRFPCNQQRHEPRQCGPDADWYVALPNLRDAGTRHGCFNFAPSSRSPLTLYICFACALSLPGCIVVRTKTLEFVQAELRTSAVRSSLFPSPLAKIHAVV